MNKKIFFIAVTLTLVLVFMAFAIQTKAANEQTATSNVTIYEYVAIGISNNLSNGIEFGSLDPATNDNNATDNYNGAGSASTMYLSVSSDSNVNVDLCIKDNANLTSDVNTIPNTGYTWDDNSTATAPILPGTAITTSYVKTDQQNITIGSDDYFRFWLDIPGGQAAGTYNNTAYFKGIKTGQAC